MREDGNYLENPLLQRGLLRGIGRLAEVRPALVHEHDTAAYLIPFLNSSDRVVQGLAAWCAGILEVQEARSGLESLWTKKRRFFCTRITISAGFVWASWQRKPSSVWMKKALSCQPSAFSHQLLTGGVGYLKADT